MPLAPPRRIHIARPSASSVPQGRLSVHALRPGALVAFAPDLEVLAERALEANPFFEPWMLLPAIEAFAPPGLRCVVVLAGAEGGAAGRVAGFLPVQRVRHWYRGPAAAWRAWRHPHAFLGAPLVDRDRAPEVLAAVFEHLSRDAGILELPWLPAEGALHEALEAVMRARGCRIWESRLHARALFRPAEDAESFLRAALDGRARKELRRVRRRLDGAGGFTVERLGTEEDPGSWIEDFLRLESSGWKRARGAMALHPAQAAFFAASVRGAAARGRLRMCRLRSAGRTASIKVGLTAPGGGSFAFKIAYDESFARFSPGVLLEVEDVRDLHEDRAIAWMDSCAAPDHPMIDRLWPGRRRIRTVAVNLRGGVADLLLRAAPVAQRLAKRVRVLTRREANGAF